MRLRVRHLPEPKPNERELLRELLLRLPRMPETGNAEAEQLRREGWGDPELAARLISAGVELMRLERHVY